MKTSDAIAHFGTRIAIARKLGISASAITRWGEVVPEGSAYKLQVLTENALRVDPSCYPAPSTHQPNAA